MIVFNDWQIQTDSELFAWQYDNLSRVLFVKGVPEGYNWRMLVQVQQYFDIIELTPMEGGVGAVLTDEMLSVAGYYTLQLRAVRKEDGATVRHTNKIEVFVGDSLSGDEVWPTVPSEFTQIERRVQAQVDRAEQVAIDVDAAERAAVKAAQSQAAAKESENFCRSYVEKGSDFYLGAQDAMKAAEKSATLAKEESTLASASATNAADAAAKAAGSAESASGYLSSVQEAANAAKDSETAAKASETAAKASETAAKASETAANTSAERAQNAKDAVVELYSAVKSNASATEEAKASAMESADEAAESASVAYSNANRAETAAAAAEEASTLASAAASNADDAAARAQDSAGEAAASAANAKASAEAAAASAAQAAESAGSSGSGGNGGNIFVAAYGVTTTDEIYTAYQAGKAVFCNYNGMLAILYTIERTDEAVFLYHTDAGMYSIMADPSGWSYEYRSAVDATLTKSGRAADAKAVGDAIGALSEEIVTTAESKVSAHNTGTDTHSDIRLLISGLTDRINALADSDDTTLDQLSEVVAYIKSNRELISAITTSKVSVADIIDNLTTNVSNKPLSAAQGVALKALIDAITVPDKLPNPNALTFTGAVTGSYDGSAPLEVAIPSGEGGTGGRGDVFELIGEATSSGVSDAVGLTIPFDGSLYKTIVAYAYNLPAGNKKRIVIRSKKAWYDGCPLGWNGAEDSFQISMTQMNHTWGFFGAAIDVGGKLFTIGATEANNNGGHGYFRFFPQNGALPTLNLSNCKFISLDCNSNSEIIPDGCSLAVWGVRK